MGQTPEEYVPRIEDTDLKRNRSGYWEITWTIPASICGTPRGRSKSRTTGTKDRNLAVKIRRDYLGSLSTALINVGIPTVREITEAYRDAHPRLGPTQAQSLKPVDYFLGDLTVDALNDFELGQYGANRARGKKAGFGRGPAAPSTIRRELGALGRALRWAKKKKRLPQDFTLPDIELPEEGLPREVFIDNKATEAAFYAHCSHVFRRTKVEGTPAEQKVARYIRRAALFAMIAMSTASRAKAIERLTWDRIKLDRKLIDYRDRNLRVTKKRRVPNPIEDRLWRELARAWIEQGKPQVGPVLGTFGEMRKSWARLKATFVPPAGVDPLPDGLTRHDLRRTWASLAAMDDVPMLKIAQMLGDTLETTEKHYAHLHPSYLRDAVNRG